MNDRIKFVNKEKLLFLLLLKNKSLGRYKLSKLMGLSKARIRSLIQYYNKIDYTYSSKGRGGTRLTKKGLDVMCELNNLCYLDLNCDWLKVDEQILGVNMTYAVGFYITELINTNGLNERDLAVREGAKGALTLKKNGDQITFANDEKITKQIKIKEEKKSIDYNMIYIAFGESVESVLNAISAVLLYHLEDKLIKYLN